MHDSDAQITWQNRVQNHETNQLQTNDDWRDINECIFRKGHEKNVHDALRLEIPLNADGWRKDDKVPWAWQITESHFPEAA
jgi:hypothetical protein